MIPDLYLKLEISNTKNLTQQESNTISQGQGKHRSQDQQKQYREMILMSLKMFLNI